MHFPSDDELMAGPNAFEGVDIDALELPDEESLDEADIDAELDEADDERAHDVEDSVHSVNSAQKQMRVQISSFPISQRTFVRALFPLLVAPMSESRR